MHVHWHGLLHYFYNMDVGIAGIPDGYLLNADFGGPRCQLRQCGAEFHQ